MTETLQQSSHALYKELMPICSEDRTGMKEPFYAHIDGQDYLCATDGAIVCASICPKESRWIRSDAPSVVKLLVVASAMELRSGYYIPDELLKYLSKVPKGWFASLTWTGPERCEFAAATGPGNTMQLFAHVPVAWPGCFGMELKEIRLDLHHLRRVLKFLRWECCEVRHSGDPLDGVYFESRTRRALIMPMRM